MTTYHIDADGNCLRSTSDPDADIPGTVTKTEIAPESGRQKWDGTKWLPLPPNDKDRLPLSARSIEALLLKTGITQAQINAEKRKQ